jgi:hypothetical protein
MHIKQEDLGEELKCANIQCNSELMDDDKGNAHGDQCGEQAPADRFAKAA